MILAALILLVAALAWVYIDLRRMLHPIREDVRSRARVQAAIEAQSAALATPERQDKISKSMGGFADTRGRVLSQVIDGAAPKVLERKT